MTFDSTRAPDTGGPPSYEERAREPRRLAAWCGFVAILISISYLQRGTGGPPDRDVFYRYSTAVGSVFVYIVILLVTCAIAGFHRDLLAARRPRSWRTALGLGAAIILVVYTVIAALEPLLHGGKEQGLTPTGWQPAHAGAYLVNAVVIAGFVPIVEELLFRGVGYTLCERFGRWQAILIVGIAFGLAHGLLGGFVQIALFGCALAWLRSRVDSVIPGMIVHGTFNAIGLAAAVTLGK